jgi:hypothetical protein
MDQAVIGPDGYPAEFRGSAWVSRDGRYFWNGSAWQPVPQQRHFNSPKLIAFLGFALIGVALVFAWPHMGISGDPYAIGYYVGVVVFFLLMFAIFRFVGRWAVLGLFIRIIVAGLTILKLLNLITHPVQLP